MTYKLIFFLLFSTPICLAQTWEPLGNGIVSDNAVVRSIEKYDNKIFVGGNFTRQDGAAYDLIASWSITTGWQNVGGGIQNQLSSIFPGVLALKAYQSKLYVGGYFWDGGENNYLTCWTPTLGWHQDSLQSSGAVRTLNILNDKLIGGGVGNVQSPAHRLIAWDGTQRTIFGGGIISNGQQNNGLYTSFVDGDDLYVGGQFSNAGGQVAHNIAKWNGTNWDNMGGGLNGYILSIAEYQGYIYAAGNFTATADGLTPLHSHLARWNGTNWEPSPFLIDNVGALHPVICMVKFKNELWLGGYIPYVNGIATNNLIVYDGNICRSAGNLNGDVGVMTLIDSSLYIGGSFRTINGTMVNHIARYTPFTNTSVQNTHNLLKITPNPFNNYIEIKGLTESTVMKIYTATGQLFLQKNTNNSTIIDTSDWVAGVYFMQFFINNTIQSSKIIKL